MVHPTNYAGDIINRGDVENALRSVLDSEQFSGAEQMSAFLKFIVEKKLDGDQSQIKAYTIAVDALGRDEDFDPQENAAVRVAAGRLRRALALYNAGASNSENNVQIELKPGSYIPQFVPNAAAISFQNAQKHASVIQLDQGKFAKLGFTSEVDSTTYISQKWIILALLVIGIGVIFSLGLNVYSFMQRSENYPVTESHPKQSLPPMDNTMRPRMAASFIAADSSYPNWFNPSEMSESMGVVMARFDDFQFLGVSRDNVVPANLDYHMAVTAHGHGDDIRFLAQLKEYSGGTVLWSTESIIKAPKSGNANIPDLIGRTYAPVASPYGVLYANLSNLPNPRSDLNCVIAGYRYYYAKSTAKHAHARDCAEEMVKQGTRLPSVYAMLTFLYLDEYREDKNTRKRDALEAATKMAERAVLLGPRSARAHQALFAIHKVRGHYSDAKKAIVKAQALNPFDSDIVSDHAAWLISLGDARNGKDLLAKVDDLIDVHPAWLSFYRFLGEHLTNDDEAANVIAQSMDISRAPLLAIAVAINAFREGDIDRSRLALDELVKSEPGFASDPAGRLIRRGFAGNVANLLAKQLKAVGLATN